MRNSRLMMIRSSTGDVGIAPGLFLFMLPLLLKAHPHHLMEDRHTKQVTTQTESPERPRDFSQPRQDHREMLHYRLGEQGEVLAGSYSDEEAFNSHVDTAEETAASVTETTQGNEVLGDFDLRKARIEIIKSRILKKLRLSERPNITLAQNIQLPRPLASDGYMRDSPSRHHSNNKHPEDFYGETKQVILLATKLDNCPSIKPSACFSFLPSKSLSPKDATSAMLWVYKRRDPADVSKRNRTLLVSELNADNESLSTSGKILAVEKSTQFRTGWVKFDMSHALRRWLHKPESPYKLIISCKTCAMESDQPHIDTSGSHIPLLVINASYKSHRPKRSAEVCSPNSSACCKEIFHVSFAEIGWSDWILHPVSYQANYCRGSCNEIPLSVGISTTYHSSVMRSISLRQTDQERRKELSPCCAGKRMSNISLLYTDESGDIVKADLPNMRVETCGCA